MSLTNRFVPGSRQREGYTILRLRIGGRGLFQLMRFNSSEVEVFMPFRRVLESRLWGSGMINAGGIVITFRFISFRKRTFHSVCFLAPLVIPPATSRWALLSSQ